MPKHSTKFRARSIEAIKPPASGQKDYWDASLPGFGLRVSAAGRKSWIVMYRNSEGRKCRYTLGVYPALSLASARKKVADLQRAVAHGADPAREKRADRRAETFAELADEYLERHAKRRKRSWRKDEQAIERDLKPRFGTRKAGAVTRADVRRLLEEIVERGSPIQANRTLEILRKIYNWGLGQDISGLDYNPCAGVERPAEERRRERVLNDDEIRAVWGAFGQETPPMAAMFKLRLLTAQRGGEVAHMRRQDISGDWWTIPGEYTKNGLDHRVPLSPQAKAVLAEIWLLSERSEWVFPGRSGDGPITVVWKAARRVRKNAEVGFVPHDLRRTAASWMTGDLGVSRLVVSKILNHVESGVTATYDRHSYDREKRQALDAWGRRLAELVVGKKAASNVVPLVAGGEPA